MGKYKAGDKFIIEIEERVSVNADPKELYKIKGFNSLVFDEDGLDRLERGSDERVN